MSEKICPRCGQPYSYIERRTVKGSKQVYFYAVHIYKEGSKWRKKRCYLGPKLYSRVTPLQGFPLRGLIGESRHRLLDYLNSIVSELEHMGPDKDRKRRLEDLSTRLA
ncbi:MAG: hypothetical protein QI199_07310, partial [Candidatus Korarchaeota archaeon]|nr:hypothetical protein [Candidatus Korarchaeota archaeon]